jgi:ketol-acid reductoisomerase
VGYVNLDEGKPGDPALIAAFKSNLIHDVLAVCAELRPSVDISVS